MKLCEKCRKNKAEIPDRERPGKPIKRLCRECHADRLLNDMVVINEIHNSRLGD